MVFCPVHHCCHYVMTSPAGRLVEPLNGSAVLTACRVNREKPTPSLFTSCQQLFCTVSVFVGLSHFTTAASPADPLKPSSFVQTLTIRNRTTDTAVHVQLDCRRRPSARHLQRAEASSSPGWAWTRVITIPK